MQADLKKRRRDTTISALLLGALALAVTQIDALTAGVSSAIALCARAIIPTLFPFLVLSELLLSLEGIQRLLSFLSRPLALPLRLSKEGGSIFLLGALFGFPIGAKLTAHYYREGALSREEAERLLLFSGNASPFFLIGSVGGAMLHSLRTGVLLYLLQLLVSLFCGFLLARFAPKPNPSEPPILVAVSEKHFSLTQTVKNAVHQSLYISGYVLLFSAVCALLLPLAAGTPFARLLAACLELGNACAQATVTYDAYSVPFCAFAASFSGLSVYFQTLDVIDETNLTTRRYLPVKLLMGTAAFFLACLFPAFR